MLPDILVQAFEHTGRGLHGRDLPDHASKRDRKCPGAGTDIEYPGVGGDLHGIDPFPCIFPVVFLYTLVEFPAPAGIRPPFGTADTCLLSFLLPLPGLPDFVPVDFANILHVLYYLCLFNNRIWLIELS